MGDTEHRRRARRFFWALGIVVALGPRGWAGDAPASPPRDVPISLDATLIGTLVIDGGRSLSLFQSAGGIRIVGEGDELTAGVRLAKVRPDRIVVERQGRTQEILLGTNGWGDPRPPSAAPPAATLPSAAPPAAAPSAVAPAPTVSREKKSERAPAVGRPTDVREPRPQRGRAGRPDPRERSAEED